MWLADNWKDYEVIDTSTGKIREMELLSFSRTWPGLFGTSKEKQNTGTSTTVTITEATKAVENGTFSICLSNGQLIIRT